MKIYYINFGTFYIEIKYFFLKEKKRNFGNRLTYVKGIDSRCTKDKNTVDKQSKFDKSIEKIFWFMQFVNFLCDDGLG